MDNGYKALIRKVKPPKVHDEPLQAAPHQDDVKAQLRTCDATYYGVRDKAILLALLDTGALGQEFLDVKLEDFNQVSGKIIIRHGKGGNYRAVFLGKSARKAVRAYLRNRSDH